MDYPELLGRLSGKRVLIWTCNTCARLCNEIGGTEASERLAKKMSDDGVDVVGVVSTSAACLTDKVIGKKEEVFSKNPDIILSMTCSAGDLNARKVFGKESLNPIITHGYGILAEGGLPELLDGTPVDDLSERSSPFI